VSDRVRTGIRVEGIVQEVGLRPFVYSLAASPWPKGTGHSSLIEHFRRLFDVEPRLVAQDLHPDYLSTKYATELAGVEILGVQHHHAHIADC
jgi:hydrogenase maturation factor HypF (carbamoyltransferase family)